MTDDDIEARVRSVIEEVLRRPIPAVEFEDDLVERLRLDSLQGLQVLAALEKRLQIRFPDERLGEVRTIRGLVDAVRNAGRRSVS